MPYLTKADKERARKAALAAIAPPVAAPVAAPTPAPAAKPVKVEKIPPAPARPATPSIIPDLSPQAATNRVMPVTRQKVVVTQTKTVKPNGQQVGEVQTEAKVVDEKLDKALTSEQRVREVSRPLLPRGYDGITEATKPLLPQPVPTNQPLTWQPGQFPQHTIPKPLAPAAPVAAAPQMVIDEETGFPSMNWSVQAHGADQLTPAGGTGVAPTGTLASISNALRRGLAGMSPADAAPFQAAKAQTRAQFPASEHSARVNEMLEGVGPVEAARILATNPGAMEELGIESLLSMAPALGAAFATGGATLYQRLLRAGVIGASSGMQTAAGEAEAVLQESGVNTEDENAIRIAMRNPEILRRYRLRSIGKGVTVGAVDFLSAFLTGGAAHAGATTAKRVGNALLGAGADMALAGGGEAAGSVIADVATGGKVQPLQWGDIFMEAGSEGPMAALQVAMAGKGEKATPPLPRTPQRALPGKVDIPAPKTLVDAPQLKENPVETISNPFVTTKTDREGNVKGQTFRKQYAGATITLPDGSKAVVVDNAADGSTLQVRRIGAEPKPPRVAPPLASPVAEQRPSSLKPLPTLTRAYLEEKIEYQGKQVARGYALGDMQMKNWTPGEISAYMESHPGSGAPTTANPPLQPRPVPPADAYAPRSARAGFGEGVRAGIEAKSAETAPAAQTPANRATLPVAGQVGADAGNNWHKKVGYSSDASVSEMTRLLRQPDTDLGDLIRTADDNTFSRGIDELPAPPADMGHRSKISTRMSNPADIILYKVQMGDIGPDTAKDFLRAYGDRLNVGEWKRATDKVDYTAYDGRIDELHASAIKSGRRNANSTAPAQQPIPAPTRPVAPQVPAEAGKDVSENSFGNKEPHEMTKNEFATYIGKIADTAPGLQNLETTTKVQETIASIKKRLSGARGKLFNANSPSAISSAKKEIAKLEDALLGAERVRDDISSRIPSQIAKHNTELVNWLAENKDLVDKDLITTNEDSSYYSRELASAKSISYKSSHIDYVREALKAGKPVPAEVLRDYPNLRAKYQQTPTKATAPLEPALRPVRTPADINTQTRDQYASNKAQAVITSTDGTPKQVEAAYTKAWKAAAKEWDGVRGEKATKPAPTATSQPAQAQKPGKKVATAKVAKVATVREPWEMTVAEYEKQSRTPAPGDYVVTPDGTVGTLRGGSLGSDRVQIETTDGTRVWASRKDLRYTGNQRPTNRFSESADEWADNVTREVNRLKKDNEDLLFRKGLTDKFKKALSQGRITSEEYSAIATKNNLLNDSDYARAVSVESSIEQVRNSDINIKDNAVHKSLVERAIRDGKPVPAEVLADYPDLQATTPATPAPKQAAKVEGETYTITPAKYAKGKVAFTIQRGESNFKGLISMAAEDAGGKWSNREKAYIMSPAQAKRAEAMIASPAQPTAKAAPPKAMAPAEVKADSKLSITERFSAEEKTALEELRQKFTTARATAPIPDEADFRKLATVGKAVLREVGNDAKAWNQEMAARLGEWVAEHLPRIWQDVNRKEMKAMPTSIKNAVVNTERAARGEGPMTEPTTRTFEQAVEMARERMKNDPEATNRLIEELKDRPRAIDDIEVAQLTVKKTELTNGANDAAKQAFAAVKSGDENARIEAQRAYDDYSNKLLDIELAAGQSASGTAGTATARGLSARRMLMQADFSLARLETQKRMDNGGRELTSEERATLQQIADDYKAKSDALEKLVAEKDERLAELASKQAHQEIVKEAQRKPAVIDAEATPATPRSYGAKNAVHTRERYDAAKERLRQRYATLRATATEVDVQDIKDLAEIIGFHLEAVRNASVDALRRRVKRDVPFLEFTEDTFRKALAQARQDVSGKLLEESQARIKDRLAADGKPDAVAALIQQVARQHVQLGVTERNALIDAVHATIKDVMPQGWTRRDTMDAISGYGQYSLLSKDDISATLRDLKGQMQQVGKLEDMQSGKAPSKTGVERRTPSAEERRLIQQVEEAKRRGGYRVDNPETQLATALSARKTYYTNRIADLQVEIAKRQRTVKKSGLSPTDAELERLKADYATVKAEHDAIFTKPGLTDAQRLQLATAAAERQVTEWEARYTRAQAGYFGPSTPAAARVRSARIDALKARAEALRQQVKELRDLANPKKTPAERALQAYKTRLTNQIADYQEKMAQGDYTTKPKRQPPTDPAILRLQFERNEIKEQFEEMRFADKLQHRTTWEKAFDSTATTINTAQAIVSSIDLSGTYRQGGFITIGNPVAAIKMLKAQFQAYRSAESAYRVEQEMEQHPDYPRMKAAGLEFTKKGMTNIDAMEEAYRSRWSARIPLVGASERAYVTGMNKLRFDTFLLFDKIMGRFGGKMTAPEAEAMAQFINVATGRGKMNPGLAKGLYTFFWTPKLVKSRLELVAQAPYFYKGHTARTRLLVAATNAQFITGILMMVGLSQLAGADDVETDPKSANFGKATWGKIPVDFSAGLGQMVTLIARLATGQQTTLDGETKPADRMRVLGNFARYKLRPAVGSAYSLMPKRTSDGGWTPGTDPVGNVATPQGEALKNVLPMIMRNTVELLREAGIPAGTIFSIVDALGLGTSVREQREEPDVQRLRRRQSRRRVTRRRVVGSKAAAPSMTFFEALGIGRPAQK